MPRSTNGALGGEVARTNARVWTDTTGIEGATYTYALKAVDAAGNLSAQTPLRTIRAFQAPTAPATLNATLASGDPRLQWAASSDNVGVAGYIVYRSTSAGTVGPEVVRTGSTTWTDASAVAGRTYTYAVKAYDAGGFLSARSPFATIKAR